MPFTAQTFGAGSQDITMAYDMLKDCKYCITGLTRAAAEAANPQLREFINSSLREAVQEHFSLSDTMVSKGWYTPADMQVQLQTDYMMATRATQRNANRL